MDSAPGSSSALAVSKKTKFGRCLSLAATSGGEKSSAIGRGASVRMVVGTARTLAEEGAFQMKTVPLPRFGDRPMKFITLLFIAATIVTPAFAQDKRAPDQAVPLQISTALPTAAPDSPEKPLPLGPSGPPPSPSRSLLPDAIRPAAKPPLPVVAKGTSILRPPVTSAELDMRIRYRQARTIAESDRNVRAAWEESRAATTDNAKRKALKRYYDNLFARILSIDRGVGPFVEQRKRYQGVALDHSGIAPTFGRE